MVNYACAAKALCGMPTIPLHGSAHHCMNCDGKMHGALCGALYHELCVPINRSRLSANGRSRVNSVGTLICATCIETCRSEETLPVAEEAAAHAAVAAADKADQSEDDNSSVDSLSTEALRLSSEALRSTINPPDLCVVEEMLNDSSVVHPGDRTKTVLFLAHSTRIIDALSVYKGLVPKKMLQFTKEMIANEICRRAPGMKINAKNNKVDELWAKMPPLTDPRDLEYIRTEERKIYDQLTRAAEEQTGDREGTGRLTPVQVMRFWLIVINDSEAYQRYKRIQQSSTREMLDAGVSFMSEFTEYVVAKHNDPSVVYSTPSQPSLHSYFARPIVCCHVPDFVLTAEKVKKIIADTRRHVTDMVMRWERSGNGSNQLVDEGDSNGEIDYDLWGRYDPETMDGDDRGSFLGTRPYHWLIVWHLCDEGDLLRFTCAMLRDEHSASSSATPSAVSRGNSSTSSARRFAQKQFELTQQIAESVKDISKAVAEYGQNEDAVTERAFKIRRLDKLRSQRYFVFSTQCNTDSAEEKAAAAAYVQELDETIATLQEEIDG